MMYEATIAVDLLSVSARTRRNVHKAVYTPADTASTMYEHVVSRLVESF